MPESISAVINPVSGHSRNFTWEYTYDASGNIINETIPNSPDSTDYYYDEAGQLLEAVNLTWDTYTEYDNGGNVTYKYIISTGSDSENGIEEIYNFEYGNENWPDQLTKVNDKPITYDAIGNPLSYDGRTYTWTSGRELASIATADMSLAFKYNDSGLRTHKTVTQNGVTTAYTYAWSQDNKLISQSDGTTTLYFIYDENDEILGFVKLTADTSELYYYVKNLQGDVYAIVDSNGTVVAEYLYDAWGYLINITGSQADTIGVLNPIRYRGYYYDTETGYYYLQSRYYDPVWGRFINADTVDHIGYGGEITSSNLFLYCLNTPVFLTDRTGYAIDVVLDIISIGLSVFDLVRKPTWINVGYLVWDVGAAFVPFIPGSYAKKGVKIVLKVADKTSDFKNIKYMTAGKYKRLKNLFKGIKGIEIHHIIEKRFAKLFYNISKNDFLSIPISKDLHKEITRRWREVCRYGTDYSKIKKYEMRNMINYVYRDMPELKKAALKWFEKYWTGAK